MSVMKREDQTALQNLNPTLRGLVPEQMGGLKNPNDKVRPVTETLRHAYVESGVMTTYAIPGDWPEKSDRWFALDAKSFPRRDSSSVEWYIDGNDSFAGMLEAIETASGPDHFIILIGWAAHLDFQMVSYGSRTPYVNWTAGDVFKKKVEEQVKLRVLIWDNTTMHQDIDSMGIPYTYKTKWFVDGLNPPDTDEKPRRAICIVDDNTRTNGAHHQKILIVFGSQGLIGFFGGVDFNSDRVLAEKLPLLIGPGFIDPHGPLHDVHARVTGEAADDLLQLAVDRWNNAHPCHGYKNSGDTFGDALPAPLQLLRKVQRPPGVDPALPPGKTEEDLPARGKDLEDLSTFISKAQAGKHPPPTPFRMVQIGQTVGNPDLARVGQQSDAYTLIRNAIDQSKKFIYIEDQYFWNLDIATALGKALPRIQHLTILLPPDDAIGYTVRHRALKRLYDTAGDNIYKVGVYVINEPVHQYVHAKMFVFDDELAIIGSANSNNRGYFYDSEVVGAIADCPWDSRDGAQAGKWYRLALNFAHSLRMKLWSEHLRVPTDRLLDGVSSAVYWEESAKTTRIEAYKANLSMLGDVPWKDAMRRDDPDIGRPAALDASIVDPRF